MPGGAIKQNLRTRAIANEEEVVVTLNREVLPVLSAARKSINSIVRLVSEDTEVSPNDEVLLVDASLSDVDIELPFAARYFRRLVIKRVDGTVNGVTVTPRTGETIELSATPVSLTGQWASMELTPRSEADWIRIAASSTIETQARVFDLTGASNTLALEHVRGHVRCSHTAACELRIPTDADGGFEPGDFVRVIQSGAGVLTFVPESGVTLRRPETLIMYKQWGSALLVHTNTQDEWDFDGDVELL